MNVTKATQNDFATIKNIIHTTINEIYPKYYPSGAVDFFLTYCSGDNIMNAILSGEVYVIIDENCIIGTGSIKGNEICRLFILPQYQGKGYGNLALNFFEKTIFNKHNEVILHSSLPAHSLYLKRGYQPIEYHKLLTDNGDYLCYNLMKLIKQQ